MTHRPSRVDFRLLMLLSVAAALAGCSRGFQPRDYANPEALFRATLLEFQKQKWDNAQLGFERLTSDLSSRDPLLAPAYFYLALTHEKKKEFLLAAQAFERVTDGFPDDTLAPTAMLGTGRAYQSLWRRPSLDPENGQKAASILRALLSSYPESKDIEDAKRRITQLEEWFAQKDYDAGVHYVKVRRAIDPAIIYFKDVVTTYPTTKAARLSWLRLHELYTKIRWKEDAAETCTAMWKAYPGDAEVKAACGTAPADSTATASAPPPGVLTPVAYARPAPRVAP
ncbi:MAG: outer membrane protein assembly factor BamD [Gemmatimonas sp.]|jgi:outer membrane assembly lipoprotein YfiO|uniref:outer membrane protein assembly factor BamD n=1 Tax=Gemmatimonas sp. TaxID=1962908 RepID=UPI00391F9469|nr:outer membrane protein assembly factor BamD [Gemmatimonadota bacterium]